MVGSSDPCCRKSGWEMMRNRTLNAEQERQTGFGD